MGSNWTFWEYQGTTTGILTGISPTEQRTYTTWEWSLIWLPTRSLPKCSNSLSPSVVLKNKTKEKGRGQAVRSGWTSNWKLTYHHSQLPSSPLKRFLSGNENCGISLVFKGFFPPTIIILLDKLSKSTCSFSQSSFLPFSLALDRVISPNTM